MADNPLSTSSCNNSLTHQSFCCQLQCGDPSWPLASHPMESTPLAHANDGSCTRPGSCNAKPTNESLCKELLSSFDATLPQQSRLPSNCPQPVWMKDRRCNEVVETLKPMGHQAAAAVNAVSACTLMPRKSEVARLRAGPEVEGSVKPTFNTEDATSQAWHSGRLSWPWEVLELCSFLESRYGSLAEAIHHIVDGHGTLDFATFSTRLESVGYAEDREALFRLWTYLDLDTDGLVTEADLLRLPKHA